MADDDGSIRTAIEKWALGAIQAANIVFEGAHRGMYGFKLMELFAGTEVESVAAQFESLKRPQTPAVRVATWNMRREKDTSQPADLIVDLYAFVACYAPSGQGMPRIGDTNLIGLNRAVEIVFAALDEKNPNVLNDDADRYAESCDLERMDILGQSKNLHVASMRFEVRVVKK